MINKIVLFNNSVNQHLQNRVIFVYGVSVGIQSICNFNYSITPSYVKSMMFYYHTDGATKTINAILNLHNSIGDSPPSDKIIVRKNDAD